VEYESYMDIEIYNLIVTYGDDSTTEDSDTSSVENEDDDLGVTPLQP
jgi:hypothetical protein